MIIGDNREAVIENIRTALENQQYNIKVEINDPVLTPKESNAIIEKYLKSRGTLGFKVKTRIARAIANIGTDILNKDTEIIGIEKLKNINGGAFITSNHFSPIENTAVRAMTRKLNIKRLNVVSQETNLAMKGIIGFLMNYADIIPISANFHYTQGAFVDILNSLFENNEYVLIYPEQEMWFNYRKPRPFKRGTYYYAAKLKVPVVSCFVEMQDKAKMENENFRKVKFILHVLDVIYPDSEKSVKENSVEMCKTDYELKKAAYEKAYGKPLTYDFEPSDIAGWVKDNE